MRELYRLVLATRPEMGAVERVRSISPAELAALMTEILKEGEDD